MCVARAVLMLTQNTNSYQKIKNCGIYSNLDHRVENKSSHAARFTTITFRDCYLFSQKGKEPSQC